ncbi:MAG: hypothetical protein GWM92_12355, partial [Gemmatimonadetes bacterium]|nr:hypothetical protein [Gemmatimonadota bacterium]NIR79285.1 hypothetical protein [Gemmatimonadota bacterium]NIT88170.1 hypothetical protein [Gemmatimonadota bacterium]NIU31793.1 hypothetical protein [Gemmatimonadota bacterium]NIU36410.1 hypothetical protein [Gemmatimonadota bacterium]
LREGGASVPRPVGEGPDEADRGRDWPDAALQILERAENRLREGDWAGFGRALEELRRTLEGARSGGGGGAETLP